LFNQITSIVVFQFPLYESIIVTNMIVYITHHASLQINFYASPHLTGCFSAWGLQEPTLYNILFFSWVFLILVSLALQLRNYCSSDRFVRSLNACFYILNILVFLNIPNLNVTASSVYRFREVRLSCWGIRSISQTLQRFRDTTGNEQRCPKHNGVSHAPSDRYTQGPYYTRRTQRLRGISRGSAAGHLLGLRVRIPPGAWMPVSGECCVLSARCLCRADDSSRGVLPSVCVCVCVCHRVW